MIIVLGSVIVKDGIIKEALRVSQQHVEHSRTEPGCIMHSVNIDSENPQRLVFVEKWLNHASLEQHFAQPTSIQFVKSLTQLVAQPPEMSIFDATQMK